MTADDVKKELKKIANSKKAKLLGKYFKTGEGEYAQGDKFLGITVPMQRKIAEKYQEIDLKEMFFETKETLIGKLKGILL